jgi:4-alpha-glucanotransferase
MTELQLLHTVARFYNLQIEYQDGLSQPRQAPAEAVLRVLQELDAPVNRLGDLNDALRHRRQALWQRVIEPVTVAWDSQPLRVKVRVPSMLAEAPCCFRIVTEQGETFTDNLSDDLAFAKTSKNVEGMTYVTRRLVGSLPLPLGYHRVYLRMGQLEAESHLISAPVQAYSAEPHQGKRWGLFCPLYALRSERSWGVGDFSDLDQLAAFNAEHGGQAVATLPMLASFLDEPFNPSPYAPVSRLFWNELFLDIERIPELQQSEEAKRIMSAGFATEMQGLAKLRLVDYRRVARLKRQVLEALSRGLLKRPSERADAFDRFVDAHPDTQLYAAFRAKTEREQRSWLNWTFDRNRELGPEDFDASAQRYHLYVQWLCSEQAEALCDCARERGTALYLDFPLGVNRDGYDVWRESEQFALKMSGGAPPDVLFLNGQNWGFPPLHPEEIRRSGYRYYIDCLRHHMTAASILRIDHIMGLHRAYWVPEEFRATDGVYVHYRAPEFYAILSLESHRHRVEIVGENLGTVPSYVGRAMARHGIYGMHVAQFGVHPDPQHTLDEVPAGVVASLNTHDTPTFMGFWQAEDVDDRVALGLLDNDAADTERRDRAAQRDALTAFLRAHHCLHDDTSAAAVLRGWLTYMAGQPAKFLLINLEDLWLEPAPQNVPGTWSERPNWQRRTRYSLEEIRRMETLSSFLRTISDIRAGIS